MIFTLFALFWLTLAHSSYATNWTFSHDNQNMTASDTESVNTVSVNSTLSRPSSGFLKKTVTSSSGSHAPSNGSVLYGLEVPGLYYLQQPTLDNEGQIIYSVASGSCPASDYNGIFVFGQWDPNGANDVTSPVQVGFGAFAWNNATNTATISNMYNLSSFSTISNFSASVYFSSCSGGTYTASGSGDRGGTLYMSSEGGAFFKTSANHGIMIVPQRQIPNGNSLVGTYSVLRYDSVANETIKNMRLSVNTLGTSVSGNALTDPGDSASTDGSYADVFTISSINSPMNGMVTGTLSHNGGGSVNLACAVHLTTRNVLFCAGQAPDLSSKPLNMVLVSDAHSFLRFQGFDGSVLTSHWDSTNNKLYVGGEFRHYGGYTRPYVARLNSDGSIDTGFTYSGSGLNTYVNTVLFDTISSKLYVGGEFTQHDGNSYKRIIRLNTDGTVDTNFVPTGGFSSSVYSLSLDTAVNKLYAAGLFGSFNGTTRKYVARLISTGGLDTAFAQTGTGLDSSVRTMAWDTGNNKLYVGGEFISYDGTATKYVARLTSGGALDTAFTLSGSGFNGVVYALSWDSSNSKLYVGGNFSSYNGTSQSRLARLNSDGTLDTAFNLSSAGFDGSVRALSPDVANNRVHVGGSFGSYGGFGTSRYTTLTTAGAMTSTANNNIGASFNGRVYVMHWNDNNAAGKLFIGGDFTRYNGVSALYLAKVLPSGNLDMSFSAQGTSFDSSGFPYGLLYDTASSKLYVCGDFTSYNGVSRKYVIRLNSDGALDTTFLQSGTGFDNYTTLPVWDGANGKLYVLGYMSSYNGTSVNKIARLNSDGTLDTAFVATGPGALEFLYHSVLDTATSKLYVIGTFSTFNGTAAVDIVRLDSNGSLDTAFVVPGTGFDNTPLYGTLDPNTRKLYVVGDFTNYNGTSAPGVVRLNTDGSLDSTFALSGTGFNSLATYLVLDTTYNKIYVGGSFTTYNGSAQLGLARFSTNGTLDTTFNVGTGPSDNDNVTTVGFLGWDSTNFKLYVSGFLNSYNGTATGPVFRLTTTGALD